MVPNIGIADRRVRVVAGIIVLCLFFLLPGNLRWLALVGIVPLATGLVNWCPAYALLGMDTRGDGRRVP